MVEIINVKERLGFLAYLLIFFVLSFTDAAIWNDGTHFLFQMVNHGLFVDHLWNRYSDVIYQIPTLSVLKIFGWNSFTYWTFKATLYFLPLLSLGVMALRSVDTDEKSRSFIWAVFFLILPFGLMFPAGIINLTVTFGTLALAVALKSRVTKWDLLIFLLSHGVLFYGHEFGVFVILALILHYVAKLKEPNSFWFLSFEILFLIVFMATKYELLMNNKGYISNLRMSEDYVGFFFLAAVLLTGMVKLFSDTLITRIVGGSVLFYSLMSMFSTNHNEFYFNVSSARFSLVPMLVLVFMAFRFWPSTIVSKQFIIHCFFLLCMLTFKVLLVWTGFHFPNDSFVGCRVLPKHEYQWTPPAWTVPMLSILKQYSLKPKRVWVISDSSECQRFGDYLVMAKDYQYHLLGFHRIIDGTDLMQNVPQAEFTLPYLDLQEELIFPRVGHVKFINISHESPIGKCLNLDIKYFPNTTSNLVVEIDGSENFRTEVNSDTKLSLPLRHQFKEVVVNMSSDSGYSMNIRSASVGSCH